jgi:Holliday junction resolvase RusA-like endonuclease
MTQYIIEIPRLPSKELSPNARVHWRTKNKFMQEDKDLVIGHVLSKYQRPSQPLTSVTVQLFFILDGRKRDWDNLCSCSKGYLDGLVDSGLIEDDNMKVIKELTLKGRRAKKKETPWTIITISEL